MRTSRHLFALFCGVESRHAASARQNPTRVDWLMGAGETPAGTSTTGEGSKLMDCSQPQ
jgi:hypothetical protein